ncbi:MAG: IS66 family insertion sequence element accessory protein TnpB [Candidatus Sedimenticola endophacoides]
MMRTDNQLPEVFLCRAPVDFLKGIQGLAVLVEAQLSLDPFLERLFVFTNRRSTTTPPSVQSAPSLSVAAANRLRFALHGG